MTRRRWPLRIFLVALLLIALAALRVALGKRLGGWVAARERARFEREVGPLDPLALAVTPVAEAANAVPAITVALPALALPGAEHALVVAYDHGRLTGPAELATLDAVLAARSDALTRLAVAARRPQSSFGPREELFHGAHVDPSAWLGAARLVAIDGTRALAGDDAPRLARALETLFGMSVTLRREPLPIFALVGEAIEVRYLELLRETVASSPPPWAVELAARQLAALATLPDAARVMHGEAVFGHAMLRREMPVATAPETLEVRLAALLWPWSPGHVEAGYLEGWRQLAALAARPQATWGEDESGFAARHSKLRRWLDPTVPYEAVRTELMPSLLEVARKLQLLDAGEQLARLAIAILAEGLRTGSLPSDIAHLPGAAARDAATGSLPSFTPTAGGGAVLELPTGRGMALEGRETAPADVRAQLRRRQRLLRWSVPPVAAAPAGVA